MESKSDWISAKVALSKLDPRTHSVAKQTIAGHLRDGKMSAFAAEVWISEAPSVSAAWRGLEKIDAQTDIELPAAFFRASKRWALDQDDWRWPGSRFSITIGVKPVRRRRMMRGVKFNAAEFAKIFDSPATSKGGRPPKVDEWHAFYHKIIEIALAGRLTSADFPTPTALSVEILEQFQGLNFETLKLPISKIYKSFVERSGR